LTSIVASEIGIVWIDWPKGLVSVNTSDVVASQITALRLVQTTGAGTTKLTVRSQ